MDHSDGHRRIGASRQDPRSFFGRAWRFRGGPDAGIQGYYTRIRRGHSAVKQRYVACRRLDRGAVHYCQRHRHGCVAYGCEGEKLEQYDRHSAAIYACLHLISELARHVAGRFASDMPVSQFRGLHREAVRRRSAAACRGQISEAEGFRRP